MNALTLNIGHDETIEALSMLRASAGFEIQRTSDDIWTAGLGVYEAQAHLSFVDSVLVAYARKTANTSTPSTMGSIASVESIG